jgi:hypothetical protein
LGKSEVRHGWVGDDAVSEYLYRCAAARGADDVRESLASRYFTARGRPGKKPETKSGARAAAVPASVETGKTSPRLGAGTRGARRGNRGMWCVTSEIRLETFVSLYAFKGSLRELVELQEQEAARTARRTRLLKWVSNAVFVAGIAAALLYAASGVQDAATPPSEGARPLHPASKREKTLR